MELKRLTGNDTTGNGVSYEVLMDRIERFMSEMTFSEEKEKRKSIFEVGCENNIFEVKIVIFL